MPPPAPSIIVAFSDPAEDVGACLRSIAAQTVADIETILIDTSDTGTDLHRLLADSGPHGARGLVVCESVAAKGWLPGLERASGDAVCLLQANASLHPEYLEKTTAALEGDPSVGFVSCRVRELDAPGRDLEWSVSDFPSLVRAPTASSGYLIRRPVLATPAGSEPQYQTVNVLAGLLERGYRGAIVPEVLLYVQTSAASGTPPPGIPLDAVRLLLEQNPISFRRHFMDILTSQDRDTCDLLLGNYKMERYLDTVLGPEILRLGGEVQRRRRHESEG